MNKEDILMEDGTPLFKFCKKNGISFSAVCLRMRKNGVTADEAVELVLNRKCSEKILNKCRKWQRLKKGYTEEEAALSKAEFKRLSSEKQSKIFIEG